MPWRADPMLILTRKSDESVIVDGKIEVKIISIRGDQVRLGFSAPRDISIHRKEVFEAIGRENVLAASSAGDSLQHIRESFKQSLGEHFDKSINEGRDV
jgi:carbon storage regulator